MTIIVLIFVFSTTTTTTTTGLKRNQTWTKSWTRNSWSLTWRCILSSDSSPTFFSGKICILLFNFIFFYFDYTGQAFPEGILAV